MPRKSATWADVLTIAQAAARSGQSEATLRSWMESGRLPIIPPSLGDIFNPSDVSDAVGGYSAFVRAHPNLKEYWPLSEAAAPYVGLEGVLDIDTGTLPKDTKRLVSSQPSYGLDNTGNANTRVWRNGGAGAALQPSLGFAFEGWVHITDLSSHPYFMVTTGGTDNGPEIRLNTLGGIVLYSRDAALSSSTANGTLLENTTYHLVVGQTAGGSNYCRVNGQTVAFAVDNCPKLTDDGFTQFIINLDSTRGMIARIAHYAWYTGSGLTEAEALSHYLVGLN